MLQQYDKILTKLIYQFVCMTQLSKNATQIYNCDILCEILEYRSNYTHLQSKQYIVICNLDYYASKHKYTSNRTMIQLSV